MMDFKRLFGVFSKRHAATPKKLPPLTVAFRVRVVMRFKDSPLDLEGSFWLELHKRLCYLLGRTRLGQSREYSVMSDLNEFVQTCSDPEFIDFLETALHTDEARFRIGMEKAFVADINAFFNQDALPYAVTDYVWQETKEGNSTLFTVLAYPQVILKESEVAHAAAIAPALALLADPRLKSANAEFLAALKDYRAFDYGDCVTKCGSAFESTMKVICHANGWKYAETDTASPLLKTVLGNSTLDPYFEQPLMLIATIRNRKSSSHGAGAATKEVAPHVAEYVLNATAAAILLLVKECL